MANVDNDIFTVGQSNGMQDNDENINAVTLEQFGGTQIASLEQDIDSGYNDQTNKSFVLDGGFAHGAKNVGNDEYTVDQTNNMFDNDQNANVFETLQLGGANVVFASQTIDSGDNEQKNFSKIFDDGYAGKGGNHSNNDTYDVGQFNGMADNDENVNNLELEQDTSGLFGGVALAFVGQDTNSGGNDQSNKSFIFDDGSSSGASLFHHSFGGSSNNDEYKVDQSNMMLDNDFNVNNAEISQTGLFNLVGLEQSIDSGNNNQHNFSKLDDSGYSHFFGDHNNNDSYDVGQESQMADNDGNANSLDLTQVFAVNLNGVEQTIGSGGNSQSNASLIHDFGDAWGWNNDDSNNDSYTVGQGNMMIDNDINLNVGIVAQVGFGNVATIDQDITSGGNTQTNNSNIWDVGPGFFDNSNNDTYDVTQSNMLADNDANQNLADITQTFGPANFADFDQDITAGDNDSSNLSNLFNFGV